MDQQLTIKQVQLVKVEMKSAPCSVVWNEINEMMGIWKLLLLFFTETENQLMQHDLIVGRLKMWTEKSKYSF